MRPAIVLACAAVAALPAPAQTPFRSAPPFRLERDLVIDGSAEDWTIIGAMVVAPDGQMAILQPQDHRVLVYAPSGKLQYRFGRKGAGPGEFERLWINAGWVADTLWVYDDSHRRITMITPAGRLARQVTLPSIVTPATAHAPPMRFTPAPRAVLGTGEILVRTSVEHGFDSTTGVVAPTSPRLSIASADGSIRRHVVELPPDSGWWEIRRGSIRGGGIPLVASPLEHVAHDGRTIATLVTQFASRTQGTFRIVTLATTGDTLFNRAYEFEGTPIAKSDVDRYTAIGEGRTVDNKAIQRPNDVETIIARLIRERMPAVYPPIRWLTLGTDGSVWVTPWIPGIPATESPRVLLDAKGNPIASVVIPKGSWFRAVSRTHLWVTIGNADGLQNVVRYRLVR